MFRNPALIHVKLNSRAYAKHVGDHFEGLIVSIKSLPPINSALNWAGGTKTSSHNLISVIASYKSLLKMTRTIQGRLESEIYITEENFTQKNVY